MIAVERADAIPWLIVAGAVLIAWCALFAIVAAATMPRLPDPGPETTELRPEAPAIANLLVSRCKLTTSAISATLVDLAARRYITIDPIGETENLVRLRGKGVDTTNAYETRVLNLVRNRANNDTVPTHELSLGYGKFADEWWHAFQKAVTEDARSRGLVRRRFSSTQSTLLAGTLAVPLAIAGIGLELYGAAVRDTGGDFDAGGGFAIAGVVWLALLVFGGARLRGVRDTPSGSAACAHWLGVRGYLAHDESFRETPPAGVAIWNRLLSYGVALGAAHGTDAALPIGPTRDDEGWSPYAGLWRQVRITYPHRFGYGDAPKRTVAASALALVGVASLSVVVVRALGPPLIDVAANVVDDDKGGNARFLLIPVLAVLSIPVTWAVIQIVRRVVMLGRALPDLRRTQTFEGYVVRVPWHYEQNGDDRRWAPSGYTAVDDARGDELRALKYYKAEVREGQVVRVTITPRMRHVVSVEPVR